MRTSTRKASAALKVLAVACVLVIVAAACGGSSSSKSSGGSSSSGSGSGGTPKPGGSITYGLEGKTTDFCLPTAQLAISGIMVVTAVYDTLTGARHRRRTSTPVPGEVGRPQPRLHAWTIKLRPNIKFQDGEPLNAAAVKQNIDAWRKGSLLSFVFGNIADVDATSRRQTVVVNMKTRGSRSRRTCGRPAASASRRRPSSTTRRDCETNMIGTGPFKLQSFDPVDR